MNIQVRAEHEEFGARLGQAGTAGDADKADRILAEIAEAGLECALAVLAVQTRNLVTTLTLLRGPDEARSIFEKTVCDAQAALDD